MSVTIKYKGNTIASANTDTTKTLQTSGKYCEADILVENVQDGGITPTGSITLTEERSYDVTEKATAVVDMSATRANLAEAVTAKGVDTLPTSSFDTIATNIGLIESGAPIPSNWEVDGGTFTLASDLLGNYTVHHNLGKVPSFVCYFSNDREHFPSVGQYFLGGWWGDLRSAECLMLNALTIFGLDIRGWTLLSLFAQSTGYLFLNNSDIQYINKDREYIENITSNSFDLMGVSTSKIPANVEFIWKAVYIN